MEEYITYSDFVRGMNNYMMAYTRNPQDFEDLNDEAFNFLHEVIEGETPTYGELMFNLIKDYAKKGVE